MSADRRFDLERGSVLILMPAAVLVLLVLGAIAVDSAVVFLAQRELANATAAAANDAATAALDEETFYTSGRLVLDPGRAAQIATDAFAARQAGWLSGGAPQVTVEEVDGEPLRVRVSAEAGVELIFAKGLPGAAGSMSVRASSVATAERAPGP